MKKTNSATPSSTGLKKAGTTVISTGAPTTAKPTKTPILTKGAMGAGSGLWCINTETSKKTEGNKDQTTYSGLRTTFNPNLDLESEFDKKIIEHLKFQVNDLNTKLINALQKVNDLDYNLQKALTVKDEFLAKFEDAKLQMIEQQERIDNLETTAMEVNEALNNARKEITRLTNENKCECEKSKNYYEMYQSLMLDKERRENKLNQEINALKAKIQQERQEKENIFKMARDNSGKQNDNDFEIKEKELQIKMNENNVNKLFNENSELRKKLSAEEANKSKLSELVRKKKEKLKDLKEEVKSYKDALEVYTGDVRWNQELVAQRDNQIKIFKEKIRKLEEELKICANSKDKKKAVSTVVENKTDDGEEIVPVKSRPFLFGPEMPDY
jgi:chromosome segregation ATPase